MGVVCESGAVEGVFEVLKGEGVVEDVSLLDENVSEVHGGHNEMGGER